MSDTREPLSTEEAAVLEQLARHEETGMNSGFAPWRALRLPHGSATLSEVVRTGLVKRCELLCGVYYRITAAGRGELRKLDPTPVWRARR